MTAGNRFSPKLVGIVTAVGVLVLCAVTFSGVFRKPFAPDVRTVTADFERAPQLRTGSQVRIQGNVEGKVVKIAPGPSGDLARVTFEVERDAGQIYSDARARMGFKTLLGGVFYIDLDRGSEDAEPLGSRVIGSDRTDVQQELDELTTVFRAGAVRGLQALPGELATGLSDAGATGGALDTLADAATDAETGLKALRGQAPGADLPQLVDAAARTLEALDANRGEVRTLVSGAAATVRATGRRSPEIRATLQALPSVTRDMTTTLARLDETLVNARGLVSRLRPPAPDVAPTLSQLRPTLVSTGGLLRSAKPLTERLPGTVDTLIGASEQLSPAIANLKPGLDRIDGKILPYLAKKDPLTGKSTSVMIGGFLAGFGGSAGQQDQNGHFIRFPASIGASSVYLPCSSSLVNPDTGSQLACDSFNDALGNYLKYTPDAGSTPPTTPEGNVP